jgi:hypothetical protein
MSNRVSIDPNGNMTGDGTKTYQWDAKNRLVAVLQGATTLASVVYGGTGKRKQKTVGGVTHTYIYAQKNVIEERIGAQTLDYVHGPGIDRPLAQWDQANVVSYYLADHLGSVAQITNGSAAVTLTREYDAWGACSKEARRQGSRLPDESGTRRRGSRITGPGSIGLLQ